MRGGWVGSDVWDKVPNKSVFFWHLPSILGSDVPLAMFVHFISFFAFIFLKFSSCLNPHLISFFQFSIFVIYLYFVFCFYLLKILSLTEFPRNPPEFSKWRKPRLHWVKNNQRWKCDKKFHGLIKPCLYALFHNSGNPRCVLIGKKSKRWIYALNLNGKI